MFSIFARACIAITIGLAGIFLLPQAQKAFHTCGTGERGENKTFPYIHCVYDWLFVFFGGLAGSLLALLVFLLVLRKLIDHVQRL
ncbi:hypothetical protein ACM64Y_01755 [Novispirillum sp. DQ9]|uniref:hypothetical protein n=1 Tax=Novispirillum sp. DQ9 TaxID=3398612 RepID=UPI003C7DBDFD